MLSVSSTVRGNSLGSLTMYFIQIGQRPRTYIIISRELANNRPKKWGCQDTDDEFLDRIMDPGAYLYKKAAQLQKA